jgi:CPA2 family monovalent cation:H+ antiporter-2
MEASVDVSGFKELLIVLGAAGVVIPLFHRLRVSPVIGYILIGVVVGPFGLGRLSTVLPGISVMTITDPGLIAPIARLGVVLLMFMIGLELSFERLWLMRRLVFGLGTLQLACCTAALAGTVWLFTANPGAALVLGLAGALSSTAVVLQVLGAGKRLGTPLGRASFAILLLQDLAVVPMLLALGMLAADMAGPGATGESMGGFGLAIAKALIALAAIVALGRALLRPLFRSVARARSPELFMAACLLVVLGTALATAAAGLSMALGALTGGLLLAGTEFRRQVEVTIEPFKGLFVGVFLISIGLGLDAMKIVAMPGAILGGAVLLVAIKTGIVAVLARLFGLPWSAGLQSGLLLGPGGEFSFVILSVAVSERLLDQAVSDPALAIAALTMALIPVLSWVGERLAPRIGRRADVDAALSIPVPHDPTARVVIAGFGRVGQMVAAMLDAHRIAYVALEQDPDAVARQRRAGKSVYYGDIRNAALLRQLDLDTARALVVTLDEPHATEEIVAAARAERSDLVIVARARDAKHAAALYRAGASDAVPETIEASLQLSEAVLVDVGIPMGPVIASIHEKRAEIQAGIKSAAPDAHIRKLGRRLRDAAPTPRPPVAAGKIAE